MPGKVERLPCPSSRSGPDRHRLSLHVTIRWVQNNKFESETTWLLSHPTTCWPVAHQEGHQGQWEAAGVHLETPCSRPRTPRDKVESLSGKISRGRKYRWSGTMLGICFRTIPRVCVCVEAGWKEAHVDLDAMKLAPGVLITADVIDTWGESYSPLYLCTCLRFSIIKFLTKSIMLETPGVGDFLRLMGRKGIEQVRG